MQQHSIVHSDQMENKSKQQRHITFTQINVGSENVVKKNQGKKTTSENGFLSRLRTPGEPFERLLLWDERTKKMKSGSHHIPSFHSLCEH